MGVTWSKDIPRTNYAMPPDKTPVLIRIPYFDNISPKDIRVLSRHFTQRNFATGDVICNEHDASMDHCFHVITKGTVSICVSEVLLRCLRHGDFFGECALVHMEDLVPVTATALSPASVLSISRDSFESFSESISSLASEVHAAHAIGGFLPPPITLRNLPLFEHMDELKLQQLALLFTVVRFESGKPIYLQDDDSDGFYIISKGTVSLEWSSPDQTPVLLDTLQADAWFGELGLESHSRRLCSAIAVQQCFLLYLSADVFRKFIKLAPELRQSEHFRRVRQSRTISMLKAIPFFHPLIIKEVGPLVRFDESKMVLLSQMFHYKTFRASDFIYREGEMGTSFYLLVLGEAEMSVSRPQDAQQVVLDTLRAGDFFGEINLLEGSTLCPSSVIATQDCTCLKLDHVHFERFFKIAPQLRIPIRNAILARTASSLRHIPFFGGEIVENKPWSKFSLLASLLVYEQAQPQQVIFREGEPGDKFYLIVVGTVEVLEFGLSADLLRAGEWFGENVTDPRECTVIAKQPCVFLTLSRFTYYKFSSLFPDARRHINKVTALRKNQKNQSPLAQMGNASNFTE